MTRSKTKRDAAAREQVHSWQGGGHTFEDGAAGEVASLALATVQVQAGFPSHVLMAESWQWVDDIARSMLRRPLLRRARPTDIVVDGGGGAQRAGSEQERLRAHRAGTRRARVQTDFMSAFRNAEYEICKSITKGQSACGQLRSIQSVIQL